VPQIAQKKARDRKLKKRKKKIIFNLQLNMVKKRQTYKAPQNERSPSFTAGGLFLFIMNGRLSRKKAPT